MNILDLFSQNIIAKVKLNAPHGVHLRPSAMISSIAKSHRGKVFISLNKNKIDAKDMNKILALGLKDGDEIEVMAGGKNAKAVVDKVVNFLSTLTNEKTDDIQSVSNKSFDFQGKKIKGDIISNGIGLGKPYFWQRNNENDVVKKQTFD
ncbi:MAG: HPr family phosphocarrier protein, partial [Epsilonproteobacteria bacterium]|nr:HPr family phosphocarrier protein [Campylobacterota bacterium]